MPKQPESSFVKSYFLFNSSNEGERLESKITSHASQTFKTFPRNAPLKHKSLYRADRDNTECCLTVEQNNGE